MKHLTLVLVLLLLSSSASAQFAETYYSQPTTPTEVVLGPSQVPGVISVTWEGSSERPQVTDPVTGLPVPPSRITGFTGQNLIWISSDVGSSIRLVWPRQVYALRAFGPRNKFLKPTPQAGSGWTLLKNYDFGQVITTRSQLEAEFKSYDTFGQFNNGAGNYGADTAALSNEIAWGSQPTEDLARPVRELTSTSLLQHVRGRSASQTTIGPASSSPRNAINGNLTTKFTLPSGGARLGQDLVFETRARLLPTAGLPVGYWYALWIVGATYGSNPAYWNLGPEIDIVETYGQDDKPSLHNAQAWHSDSVGGTNLVNFGSWHQGMAAGSDPRAYEDKNLKLWHVWTLVYRKDNTYEVLFDGYRVQYGVIDWSKDGRTPGIAFTLDCSWGHTGLPVGVTPIALPSSGIAYTCETDYLRIYTR